MTGGNVMAQINVNNLTFYYEGSFDNIFENSGWTIYNVPWANETKFDINNIKNIAIKAEKIIPQRLLHKNGTIDEMKLREIQVCISEYMIENPEYINMFFRKEKEYKKTK